MKYSHFLTFSLSYLLTFSLAGCIEEYEADIPSDDSNLLVVEGTICSGELNKFILSRTQSINGQEENVELVTGAKVSVKGSDGSEYTTQSANGYYACQMEELAPDVEYYLHIETDGEVYESEPQKPLRTEGIAEVIGVQDTPESSIDILVTPADPFESDEAHYYSWTYDETWEVHPDYTTSMYYDTETLTRVYQGNLFPKRGWKDAQGTTIMVGASTSYDGQHIRRLKLYDIGRDNWRMFHKYSGLVHQRAISKAEYEYELARRQAGSEMGGLFTPQPSALPTNIHCLTSSKHVIGYVGCSLNTSEYRFFLKEHDYSIYQAPRKDTRIWLVDPTDSDCLKMVYQGYYLCEWEDPLVSSDGLLHTAWATIEKLDVRYKYKGVYIEKPDFWNDEDE